MLPDLKARARAYFEEFAQNDEEFVKQEIDNAHAADFLTEEAPLVDLPDTALEKIYYFRWWTFRKHFKKTPEGHVMTEFLPPVKWAREYNTICCPASHHFREGRWLKDREGRMKEYLHFWLSGRESAFRYSGWLLAAAEDYFTLHPDKEEMSALIDPMARYLETEKQLHAHSSGLYWSNDNRDGMEYSLSGPGLRPTVNSYICADTEALSRMAAACGRTELAEKYAAEAAALRKKIDALLWDRDFYRTIPCAQEEDLPGEGRPEVAPEHCAREEVGYIPWYFGLASKEKDGAWKYLRDENYFASPCGITTAERNHPRFLFEHTHECLWNGYVWPFATAQTLTALARVLHERTPRMITKEDYYVLLKQYAAMHRLTAEDGRELPWIDEVMHPFSGKWTSRELLKEQGWLEKKGGYERGKDYNHSTFCDLILSGLLGIRRKDGLLEVSPLIPDDWDHFCVSGLTEEDLTVLYDRDGSFYGSGAGLKVLPR